MIKTIPGKKIMKFDPADFYQAFDQGFEVENGWGIDEGLLLGLSLGE